MSDPARPCGPSLYQSVRYLIGLDVAQWARRNRVEPPWFILTRIGAVALAPAVASAGVLVFGAGYAFGATLWSLSVERTRGLGLLLAIGVISALVGIGSSGLRSSVSNVLLSSNASHLVAVSLHPLSLLVHRGMGPIVRKSATRFLILTLLVLGCVFDVRPLPWLILLLPAVLAVVEAVAGIAVLMNKLVSSTRRGVLSHVWLEVVMVPLLLGLGFMGARWIEGMIRSANLSEEFVVTALAAADATLTSAAPVLLVAGIVLGAAGVSLILWRFARITAYPYAIPGSLRVQYRRLATKERHVTPRSLLSARLAAILWDDSRSAVVSRLQSRLGLRLGALCIGALLGFDLTGRTALSGWERLGLCGAVVTFTLMLGVSYASAQGFSVWLETLRWLVDLGMSRSRAVLHFMSGTLLVVLLPVLPLVCVGAWLTVDFPFAIGFGAGCYVVAVGALAADLLDAARTTYSDGTTEAGVVGDIVSGGVTAGVMSLLALPSVAAALILVALAILGTVMLGDLMRRRLMGVRPR